MRFVGWSQKVLASAQVGFSDVATHIASSTRRTRFIGIARIATGTGRTRFTGAARIATGTDRTGFTGAARIATGTGRTGFTEIACMTASAGCIRVSGVGFINFTGITRSAVCSSIFVNVLFTGCADGIH